MGNESFHLVSPVIPGRNNAGLQVIPGEILKVLKLLDRKRRVFVDYSLPLTPEPVPEGLPGGFQLKGGPLTNLPVFRLEEFLVLS